MAQQQPCQWCGAGPDSDFMVTSRRGALIVPAADGDHEVPPTVTLCAGCFLGYAELVRAIIEGAPPPEPGVLEQVEADEGPVEVHPEPKSRRPAKAEKAPQNGQAPTQEGAPAHVQR